jgi:hypothetical protein
LIFNELESELFDIFFSMLNFHELFCLMTLKFSDLLVFLFNDLLEVFYICLEFRNFSSQYLKFFRITLLTIKQLYDFSVSILQLLLENLQLSNQIFTFFLLRLKINFKLFDDLFSIIQLFIEIAFDFPNFNLQLLFNCFFQVSCFLLFIIILCFGIF